MNAIRQAPRSEKPLADFGFPCSHSPDPQDDFGEALECELEPLDGQEIGAASVSLTITNMPPNEYFRIEGTAMLPGFSFLVSPRGFVFP